MTTVNDPSRVRAFWEAFLEAAPAGVAIFDRDMRYLEASRRWKRDFALEDQALVGRSHYDVFPDLPERWKEIHRRCLAGATERCDADPFPRANGSVDWVRWEVRPWREEDGGIGGIVIFSEMITERQRIEDALRAQEALFRGLVEQEICGIVLVGGDHRLTYVNPRFAAMTGYRVEELLGRPLLDLVPPEERAIVVGAVERQLNGDASIVRLASRMATRSGNVLDILVHASQSTFEGAPASLAVVLDVTGEKEWQASQRAATDRLRAIIESTDDAIISLSTDGIITTWNHAAERIYGYTAAEIIGKSALILAVPGREDDVEAVRERVRRGEHVLHYETRRRRKDGRIIDVLVSTSLIRDPQGLVIGTSAIVEDVTEQKAAERHRAELERQLRQAQKMDAVGQLTGGVAHDFNNILAVVLGNLELVLDDVEGNEVTARRIASAIDAARRGADLTHRLLAFSRRQPLAPVRVDVNQKIGALIPLLSRTLGEQIELRERLAQAPWKVNVDPGQLDNAILNLSLNSRDAMPAGGTLTISTENVTVDEAYAAQRPGLDTGRYVRISVSDSGSGMSPEVLAKAFDPFFTTKEVGKGTGLGLSMVYGFAQQSGGKASIYSEEGVGTTATLLLPAEPNEQTEPAATRAPDLVGGNEAILLVEDDPDVRNVTVAFLKSLGYTTRTAGAVMEGLDILRSDPSIDLVMTDVILPGGFDGGDLARQAQIVRPGLKILFLSGYTEDVIMHDGRLDPGVVLLHKPFTRHDLATKVRAVLDGGAA